ncbi:MAG TPA: glycine cleavage system aminomethyltransferase GcvT, partial [Isosphaeraceae bacterium]|nr:glycine cleavage system aminomethyltransferase GcvT [Isosphaeraceae bacterium]
MPGDAPLKTPLFDWHSAHHGRIVEFGGWAMPVQYSSIIDEHQAVRTRVGLFDISHMGRLLIDGPDALAWIERISTNCAARLEQDQIQYSLLVNEAGGVLDDILVYRLAEGYAIVCNASNRMKVLDQFAQHKRSLNATLTDRTLDTAMIALQGPLALATLECVFEGPLSSVPYYHSTSGNFLRERTLASRTGYTGEDGFELVVDRRRAEEAWNTLMEAGREHSIQPCGLGARDTLRFEAAMPLYGHELDETINPYAAGLGWAVKLDKGDFIGRDALRVFKARPGKRRIGLALEGKRIARQGCAVKRDGLVVGTVTSGTFGPTLERSLAMAMVEPGAHETGQRLSVDVRGHDEPAQV